MTTTTRSIKSGDTVRIADLPVGATVACRAYGTRYGGYPVGSPILIDGGDQNDPEDYRFRVRDGGGQWDWVQGSTKYVVIDPRNDKPLHKNSIRYLANQA